jgi:hypothetical protein
MNAVIRARQRFQPIYEKIIYITSYMYSSETFDSKGFQVITAGL